MIDGSRKDVTIYSATLNHLLMAYTTHLYGKALRLASIWTIARFSRKLAKTNMSAPHRILNPGFVKSFGVHGLTALVGEE